ncbi:MetQ/NlpA family ABC transporter substrate-binding protein [Segniliparus rotundus]|uniref:MetQ/NlpA family ABC transporter substrate-binding protein n=1 Tax=Segniliparus rotundus TaxID=286802 RepID=UPI001FE207FB|nr:MetQ/NlpA family ABC transporter substrate-binding protein [Segniliparus rotundus]
MRTAARFGIVPAALALLAGALGACGSPEPTATVKIGTTDDKGEGWKAFVQEAKRQGINLETTPSWDYLGPNDELENKQVDVNLAQHLRSLARYNVEHGTQLAPIASTYIVPLGLYSKKHRTLAEIPQGAKIAIPDYPPDTARALFVLRSAGLVVLKGDPWSPTKDDVDPSSKVAVETIKADFLVRGYTEDDGAVVNNTWLASAGIDPSAALAKDDPSAINSPDPQERARMEQYINVIVARSEDKNNPLYKRLGDIYHAKPVQDTYARQSKGSQIDVKKTPEELQSALVALESRIRADRK